MTHEAGIIGTGGIAGMGILGMHDEEEIGETKVRASHAGGYRETEGIELVAVADVDADALARFGDAWDVPAERQYVGHERMFEAEDLDIVSVCTPTVFHADHVVDEGNGFVGPGHNAVVADDAGQDWLLYHAYEEGEGYIEGTPRRPLMIDRLDWADGWPRVENRTPGREPHIPRIE
jgi:hypothetical protein